MLGLHIVKKPLKRSVRYYVYAWRGGPCIHQQDDTYPVFDRALMEKFRQATQPGAGSVPENSFEALTERYAEKAFPSLAQSTSKEYRRLIRMLVSEFGSLDVQSFDLRQIRGDILNYRDSFEATPRKADALITMLATILSWAVDRGELTVNMATNIKKLHKSNRSDLIWEDSHWEAYNKAAVPAHVHKVIELTSLTGMRLGDAIMLPWEAVYPNRIEYVPNKGRRHNARAVIPLYPALQGWILTHRPNDASGIILLNSRGKPWTEDGFESSYGKVRPKDFGRTFHDLRGTFATRLMLVGASDAETAMCLGWATKRVEEIRKRYVDEHRILVSLGTRLAQTTLPELSPDLNGTASSLQPE